MEKGAFRNGGDGSVDEGGSWHGNVPRSWLLSPVTEIDWIAWPTHRIRLAERERERESAREKDYHS